MFNIVIRKVYFNLNCEKLGTLYKTLIKEIASPFLPIFN